MAVRVTCASWSHVRLTALRVLDGPAGQPASLDHILSGGGVVGFAVAHDVYDVRPEMCGRSAICR